MSSGIPHVTDTDSRTPWQRNDVRECGVGFYLWFAKIDRLLDWLKQKTSNNLCFADDPPS